MLSAVAIMRATGLHVGAVQLAVAGVSGSLVAPVVAQPRVLAQFLPRLEVLPDGAKPTGTTRVGVAVAIIVGALVSSLVPYLLA